MIEDFENMTEEEFEIICEELLPAQKEVFNLIKEKGLHDRQKRTSDCIEETGINLSTDIRSNAWCREC